jgi:hypothetical protein
MEYCDKLGWGGRNACKTNAQATVKDKLGTNIIKQHVWSADIFEPSRLATHVDIRRKLVVVNLMYGKGVWHMCEHCNPVHCTAVFVSNVCGNT